MTNLEDLMKNNATSAIYSMTDFDPDEFREAMQDRAFETAESATTYNSECLEIICRYEIDPRASEAEDLADSGKTYKASEWQEAQTDYARAVALCVLRSVAGDLADEAETAADELAELAEKEGADSDDLTIPCGASCPYGWSAHNYETDSGAMVWRNLEGSRAVAVQAGGIWLYAIWTPETQDATPNT